MGNPVTRGSSGGSGPSGAKLTFSATPPTAPAIPVEPIVSPLPMETVTLSAASEKAENGRNWRVTTGAEPFANCARRSSSRAGRLTMSSKTPVSPSLAQKHQKSVSYAPRARQFLAMSPSSSSPNVRIPSIWSASVPPCSRIEAMRLITSPAPILTMPLRRMAPGGGGEPGATAFLLLSGSVSVSRTWT